MNTVHYAEHTDETGGIDQDANQLICSSGF